MAVEKFTDAGIFYDGKNYTGQTNKVTLSRKVNMLDTSVFGIDTKVNAPGQDEVQVHADGWWFVNDAATAQSPDPNLFNELGASQGGPLLIYPKNLDGGPVYFHPAVLGTYNFFGTFGELAPFSVDWSFSSQGASGDRVQQCRGVLGLPFAAYAASPVVGTFFQFPAVFGAGDFLVFCVQLISTDATNVVFSVESDDASGFPSAVTRLTTPTMTAGQVYLDDLQGPIATDTFFRIRAVRTGGTTFSAVAAFGKTTPQ